MNWGVDEYLLGMVLKWTPGVSFGVFDSDTLGLRLVCKIGIKEVPSLGIIIEYTLGTWVVKSLAVIDGTKLGKQVESCKG